MSLTDEQHEALRKPFDPSVIGKLPKGGVMLDYVGHATVTDRLLTVDPEWSWEPVAYDEAGLPRYDKAGGLWIRLTVCGVTRLGYGDGPDPKQRISDALRNAAMRFGVALALWGKDGLESEVDAAQDHDEDRRAQRRLDDDARAGGWVDEAQRRGCDQQAVSLARTLSPEARVAYRDWFDAERIKRPMTKPEWEKVHAKLSELKAAEDKAEAVVLTVDEQRELDEAPF